MQLSDFTVNVLKNFSQINQGLVIAPGTSLYTRNVAGSILAKAELPEDFDKEIVLYDVSNFLQVYSLLDSPEFELYDDYMIMSSGGSTIKYYYPPKEIVYSPTQENINKIESASADLKPSFTLSSESLSKLQKASMVMKLSVLNLKNLEGNIVATLKCTDAENTSKQNGVIDNNTFNLVVAQAVDDQEIDVTIDFSLFKTVAADYDVSVSDFFIRLQSDNLTYWLATYQ